MAAVIPSPAAAPRPRAQLQQPTAFLPPWGWAALIVFLLLACVAMPLLALVVPQGSSLHVSPYWIGLAGKILCYAMVALAMDLVWGYAGILSLGHGLFFALGGYAMGMYLNRAMNAASGNLPDFMQFMQWTHFPWYWAGTQHFAYAMFLAVAAPGLLAFVFGFFAFRSRIKGVYFSIITQALTYAAMLLFFRNETGFGGNNGLTDFKVLLGFPVGTTGMTVSLFVASSLALAAMFLFARWLVRSKFGRVLTAIRDAESRVMFCGYNPLWFKLGVWTISAMMCGVAGALYAPQVGIINPSEMSTANSIEIAIWAAIGGRGTLIGPIVGAVLVNAAKSWLTVAMPEVWLYLLGGLFIVVTLFAPYGLAGIWTQWRQRRG
ncbi:MAG: urea ABC transporter permease subunit UrtC [Betaproteobacteria bacterium]|jgi:urea transport system permease protein|uniref:urea ABC transporter permease subunit UrtC n=1 Tax=Thiomonas sp. TaxID=2047785 RepID=UPI000BD5972B|nr:urea ABC transporter permease subunit UrtC [Thiomonas sp.]MDE2130875.1 urea ABC transporter permease subunit UrtC [Betaproteobacteria bacterium]OZB44286.1 MAG: urea ABC transporter permease subunit UrtC [Thiomonas sp. 15-66-11]OZB62913.1 MAG: urea ABC transporter permease subunit UrtC [Thiomonas sp. 13-66-29]